MPIRRRFGVRATAPDAMARNLALLRAFRDLERRRVTIGAAIGVAVVAAIAAETSAVRPGPLVTLACLVAAAVLLAAITFGIAAIGRPRRVARALELYRWVARSEALDWRASTGEPVPDTPARARAWLERHPAAGGSADAPRIPLLVWIGELDAARGVAQGLPGATPDDRFERALLLASVAFVATGDGDLEPARAVLSDLPDARQPFARARLAIEEARQSAAAGRAARVSTAANGVPADYLDPLGRARDDQGSALDGFLLPDLFRWVARPLVILGGLSSLISFLVAGALPPR